MLERLRRPLTLLWLVAAVLALLIGVAVAGPPGRTRDVPLRERKVVTTVDPCATGGIDCTSPTSTLSPATTAATAPGSSPTSGPTTTGGGP